MHEKILIQARNRAVLWARDLLASNNFVVLDTETTGLAGDDEVIQLAVIDPNGKELFNELLNPSVPISPDAQAVHHINKTMLLDKPEFKDVSERFLTAIAGKTVVTYNVNFDRRLLLQTAAVHGVDFGSAYEQQWTCAMENYAAYYGDYNSRHGSFRWQKLQGGDHSALGDCRATLDLIKRMAAYRPAGEA